MDVNKFEEHLKTKEQNKKIVRNLFKYYNNRDWDNYFSCFEDEAFTLYSPHFEGEINKIVERSNDYFFKVSKNPAEVMKIAKKQGIDADFTTIGGLKRYIKLEAEVEEAVMRPAVMIAENDEIWSILIHTAIDVVTGNDTQWFGLHRAKLRNGKVIGFQLIWNYLNVLIDMGKIAFSTNEKEKLDDYIGRLKELGLIPENMR